MNHLDKELREAQKQADQTRELVEQTLEDLHNRISSQANQVSKLLEGPERFLSEHPVLTVSVFLIAGLAMGLFASKEDLAIENY